MARLIDADELISKKQLLTDLRANYEYGAIDIVEAQPNIDPVKHGYVPIEVVRQIQWERDVAIDQLNSYGVQLGEKQNCKG